MRTFRTAMKNSFVACLCTAALVGSLVSAESSLGKQQCEGLQPGGASVQFLLYMQLEERHLPMKVPTVYFEDAWDLVEGAEHRAQLFGLDFETLHPLKRIDQHRLNQAGKLNLLSVLLHDTIGPTKRLRYTISEAQQWRVDKDSTAPIDEKNFRYGLKEVNLGNEPYDRVFFAPSQNGSSPVSIICPGTRPVRHKLCRHYFRSNRGIDVDLTYPMIELSRWSETQRRVERLIDCFTPKEN